MAENEALRAGLVALREALSIPVEAREGAHALLAADALLTWAVEDAAHAEDPETALLAVLEGVIGVDAGGRDSGASASAPPAFPTLRRDP